MTRTWRSPQVGLGFEVLPPSIGALEGIGACDPGGMSLSSL
jgi:hypothetical protein